MKNILLILVFVLHATTLLSQNKHHEKIKALKVGYITEQLELTASEAEAFWPIYNDYDKKHSTLRNKERSLMHRDDDDTSELTELEAKNILNELMSIEALQTTLEEKYISDLENVLSSKKVLKLLQSEKNFRKKLLHRLRDEKNKG